MKKTAIRLITLALSLIMILSLTACNFPGKKEKGFTENDYKDMIEEFVSDDLNTFELTIGEEAAPQSRVWLNSGKGTTYSSDTSVVTVTDGGKVTAVGEGTAYVVITSDSNKENSLHAVYRYDVYGEAPEADLSNLPRIEGIDFADEIANFNSTKLNTIELKTGETHSPTAALWAQSGGTCYTSDASVVTVNNNGNVTAEGRGTAYVVIKTSFGDMFEIYKYVVKG